MADDLVHGERSGQSLDAHVQTYGSVIALLKWGTLAAVIVAALVIWLIAS